MSLTDQPDRDDLLLLRARYVELLRSLQRTADHNPETVDALARLLPETAAESADKKQRPPAVQPAPPAAKSKRLAAG